jgi:acetyltransferase-like isoleucine patch superfamily enzyme
MNILHGDDVLISKTCNIKRPTLANLGNHVAIDDHFYCTTQLTVGNYVHISAFVSCIGGSRGHLILDGFNNVMTGARIICGSDIFDGSGIPGAMIPDQYKSKTIIKDIIVEKFANIGTNAVVMPGSRLRRGALLCIGSVLFGDTEEWGVYKGNPAEITKKINPDKIMDFAKRLDYSININE